MILTVVTLIACSAPASPPPVQQQQPVDTSPKIGINPQTISVDFKEGQSSTVTKTATLMNEGGGVMIWAARKSQAWLWMNEADGALEKGYSKNLEIFISPSGLQPGTYKDSISVEATGTRNSPQTIQVTMVISPQSTDSTGSDGAQLKKAVPPPPWAYDEYKNDTYNFVLKYPKDYEPKQFTVTGAVFGAVSSAGKQQVDNIMVVVAGSYGVDYKSVAEELTKGAVRLMGGKPNPTLVTQDNTTTLADGITPAYEFLYESKSSASPPYQCYVFGAQKKNRYIFFGAVCPLSYAPDKIDLWKQIARTLEFND